MLKDIVEVEARPGHVLWLRFEDGVEGEINVSRHVTFDGVFAALKDHDEFARVRLNREVGTVEWPSGADLDPDVLYAHMTGQPISLGADEPAEGAA